MTSRRQKADGRDERAGTTDPAEVDAVVRLSRRIPAPPAQVYRAWLEPDLIRQWFAPAGLWVSRVEVDAREGGVHRVWQDDGSGLVGGSECELLELVPDRLLVFRWRFVGPDRVFHPAQDSRLTITFADAPDGQTDLVLVHERLGALAAAHPAIVAGATQGWTAALEKLTAAIAPMALPDATVGADRTDLDHPAAPEPGPATRGHGPMPTTTPCLWFDGQAEDAATYYVEVFPRSEITHIDRYGPGMPVAEGTVLAVGFALDGQSYLALNGGPRAGFSEAISFQIACADSDEVDHYWDRLTDGGEEGRCGWLKDRFGVSWQVVPNALPGLLGDPDPGRAQRAMEAMMGMTKLDVAALRKAADGVTG